LNACCIKNQTTLSLAHLDVPAGHTFDHTTLTNSNLGQSNAPSWVIVTCIKGISV
jgi:hypothetical protein